VGATRHGLPGHAVALALALRRFLDHGHFDDALTVHSAALAAAGQPGTSFDATDRAELFTAVGITCWRLGRLDTAAGHLERATATYVSINDPEGTARGLALLGLVRDTQGRFADALNLHNRGLRIAREARLPKSEAAALINLAYAHVHLRDYARAAGLYRRAQVIVRQGADRYPQAVVAAGLALAHEGLGDLALALTHAEVALLVNQEFDLPRGRALILDGIGSIYRRLGRLGDALDALGEALSACRGVNDGAAAAQIHNTLGETHRDAGAPTLAIVNHRASLAVADRIGNRLQRARAQEGLGEAYAALGDIGRAQRHLEEAEREYRYMGIPVAVSESSPAG
jgi:tetratricopeptide (TPR) repeat protein